MDECYHQPHRMPYKLPRKYERLLVYVVELLEKWVLLSDAIDFAFYARLSDGFPPADGEHIKSGYLVVHPNSWTGSQRPACFGI